jgi:hypothetical protein
MSQVLTSGKSGIREMDNNCMRRYVPQLPGLNNLIHMYPLRFPAKLLLPDKAYMLKI